MSTTFTQCQYWQGHRSAKMMENQGGFCYHLAQSYYKADMSNARRLYEAFPDLFTQSAFQTWKGEDRV